jgi:hypothetical protein
MLTGWILSFDRAGADPASHLVENQVKHVSNTYAPCEAQQLRALRMLAGCPDGATAIKLLMHAFEKRCMTRLVACGYCNRERRTGHVDRYRITQAGEGAAAV